MLKHYTKRWNNSFFTFIKIHDILLEADVFCRKRTLQWIHFLIIKKIQKQNDGSIFVSRSCERKYSEKIWNKRNLACGNMRGWQYWQLLVKPTYCLNISEWVIKLCKKGTVYCLAFHLMDVWKGIWMTLLFEYDWIGRIDWSIINIWNVAVNIYVISTVCKFAYLPQNFTWDFKTNIET